MSEGAGTEIPVFFHIPRCAGTYIYEGVIFPGLLGQHRREIRTLANDRKAVKYSKFYRFDLSFEKPLQFPGEISCLVSFDLNKMPLPDSESAVFVDHFKELLRQDLLKIRGVVINPIVGDFRQRFALIEELCQMSVSKPYYFTILRKSIDWHRSMFFYLKHIGVWERTFGAFGDMSFSEYINSKSMADSWIIRMLTMLPDNMPIVNEQYEEAVKILSKYNIGFVDDISAFVKEISERFGWSLMVQQILANKNESEALKMMPISNISESDLKTFNERAKYDIKLYEHFRVPKGENKNER